MTFGASFSFIFFLIRFGESDDVFRPIIPDNFDLPRGTERFGKSDLVARGGVYLKEGFQDWWLSSLPSKSFSLSSSSSQSRPAMDLDRIGDSDLDIRFGGLNDLVEDLVELIARFGDREHLRLPPVVFVLVDDDDTSSSVLVLVRVFDLDLERDFNLSAMALLSM